MPQEEPVRTTAVSHYEILHIQPSATLEEINEAYRTQIQLWHTDKISAIKSTTQWELTEEELATWKELSQRINNAYTTLKEAGLRNTYDHSQRERSLSHQEMLQENKFIRAKKELVQRRSQFESGANAGNMDLEGQKKLLT